MEVPQRCERAAERVREAFGDDLRAVVIHQFAPEKEWDVRYVREDVRAGYDTDDLRAVLEDVTEDFVFEALIQDWHEEIRRLGVLHGSVLVFDDAVVVRVVLDDRHGICVSLEPDHRDGVFDVIENLDAETAAED